MLDDFFLGVFPEPLDGLIELNNEVFTCGKFGSVEILTALVQVVTVITVLHVLVFIVVEFLFIVELIKDLQLVVVFKLGNHFKNLVILKNLNKTVATLPGLLYSVVLRSSLVLSLDRKTFVPAFQRELIHDLQDLWPAETGTKRRHLEL